MKRKAQGALEYLFMIAAVLVLVLYATKVILNGTRGLEKSVGNYTEQVRKQILENL
ncbi:class III signal peptide-containing protein [Thermococcus sp.]|uniref:class III signal peptide-containing protein n=1 Tax=Thermococcus sp. TaxID=35749 RepID=UPI0025DF1D40|nr:class III signal peptide-containing protein [Thermococcus sp.]